MDHATSAGCIAEIRRPQRPTLATIVKLLRADGRLDVLDEFIPSIPVSPMQLLRDRQSQGG